MNKIKLGIIGVGNMGSMHAQNIRDGRCPDIEIAAIADANAERLAWAKQQGYGAQTAYFENAEDMLNGGLINACLIAVPHYDHTAYAIECIKRDIHVMVEKPAGVYTKQVREMNAEADRHPAVVFGMMFNQRTNCIYKKLKEMIDSGKYGAIRRTNWLITDWYRPQAYYNSGGWRATWAGEGGGVLLNQCPHQLDLWQWICGMPKRVLAKMHYGKWHDIEVEDDVSAYVEYENGATGVFITTTGDGKGTNRFEIQTDKAKFVVENGVLTVDEFEVNEKEFTATNTKPFGYIPTHRYQVETDGENPQHVGVLNAWADAILRNGKPIADGREGIHSLTLSNAMHLSAFWGKEIEIPFDEDLYLEELMKRVKTSRHKPTTKSVFADTSGTFESKEMVEKHYMMQ